MRISKLLTERLNDAAIKNGLRQERLLSFLLLSLFHLLLNFPLAIAVTSAKENYDFSSRSFLENQGQIKDLDGSPAPYVLFKIEQPGLNIFLTEKGLTYMFFDIHVEKKKDPLNEGIEEKKKSMEWCRMDMLLESATIKKKNIIKEQVSAEFYNYYIGRGPAIKQVRKYGKLTVKNIYEGIDWVLYENESGLKYDFIVHPGADPALIKINYEGAGEIALGEGRKSINIKTPIGELQEGELICFLDDDRKELDTHYELSTLNELQIRKGTTDKNRYQLKIKGLPERSQQRIVIDPQLVWSTFYGGNLDDGPQCISADNNGNVFVVGYVISSNFPFQDNGTYYDNSIGGSKDALILKFTNTGALQWATSYGGGGREEARGISVNSFGNIFITGYTQSLDFFLQDPSGGAYFNTDLNAGAGAQRDAFIAEFDNSGNILWSTYFGGSKDDLCVAVKVDNSNNIYVVGSTQSSDMELINPNGGAFFDNVKAMFDTDAFILKFDNNRTLKWSTFFGGNSYDYACFLETDNNGNLIMVGKSQSPDMEIVDPGGNAYVNPTLSGMDAFIAKFSNIGALLWSTFYGGSGSDYGYSIVVDREDNIFVAGETVSNDFPVYDPGKGAYYQQVKGGVGFDVDMFILKFSSAGERKWATYYGGNDADVLQSPESYKNLAVDKCGNIYLSFNTRSSNLPVLDSGCGYYKATGSMGRESFLSKFSNSGIPLLATYFGGSSNEFREAICIDKDDNLYMVGEWIGYNLSTTSSLPLTNPGNGAYYIGNPQGEDDGYIVKFSSAPLTFTVTPSTVAANCGCNGTAEVSVAASPTCNNYPYTYIWSNGATTAGISSMCAGTYSVVVEVCYTKDTSYVTIGGGNGIDSVTVDAVPLTLGCNGDTNGIATLTVYGNDSPFSYQWSNNATNSVVTNLSAGIYFITVTDNFGCIGTTSLTIAEPPLLTSSLTVTNIKCNGELSGEASLAVTGGTGNYTYQWSGGASNSSQSGLAGGSYPVTITDENGCSIITVAQIIEPPVLTVSIVPLSAICEGQSATVSCIVTGGTPGYQYNWNDGNTGSFISIAPSITSIYSLTVTDNNGCMKNASESLVVNPLPAISFTSDTTAGCQPLCVNFNNTTPNTQSLFWAYGDSSSGANATEEHCYNEPGIYSVSLTATSTNGCSATYVKTNYIEVYPKPIASFIAFPQPVTMLSPTIYFTDKSSNASQWLWSFGDVNPSSSTQQHPSYMYQDTGKYIISLIVVSDQGCADTTESSIVINAENALFVPNSFTPNGDDLNDLFLPLGTGIDNQEYEFMIFDRWGNLMFRTTKPGSGWDGKANGGFKLAQIDTYVWKLKLKDSIGVKHQYMGHVNLVR